MRVIWRRATSDTIELLDPAAEILRHVAFESMHCAGTESVCYDLALSPMFDTVAHVEYAWYP